MDTIKSCATFNLAGADTALQAATEAELKAWREVGMDVLQRMRRDIVYFGMAVSEIRPGKAPATLGFTTDFGGPYIFTEWQMHAVAAGPRFSIASVCDTLRKRGPFSLLPTPRQEEQALKEQVRVAARALAEDSRVTDVRWWLAEDWNAGVPWRGENR